MTTPPPTPRRRRTWPQRLTLVLVALAAFASFATAGVLAAGHWVLSQRQLVELADPVEVYDPERASSSVIVPGATDPAVDADLDPDDPSATTSTIPLAEPDAANFLITGADNGDCLDVDDATVGDRSALGERSDTIMLWRVNPDADQLAVLSFPRDLYVDLAGGSKGRINGAYERNDPTRLIETINLNFGLPVDHYIQVDFCAFRRLVEAVGGVDVPFQYPAKDTASGLFIPEAGCVTLDPDMALAYVRSRKYRYEDPPGSGNWIADGTSDFGRINRQQDFLRRVVAQIIGEGLYRPSVAEALIDTNRKYVVTDSGLTMTRMLEFSNALRSIDPASIATYRIESYSDVRSGQQVEIPTTSGENMQAILSVFRGEATLASAPDQVFETTTMAPPATVEASDTPGTGSAPRSTSDETDDGRAVDTTLPTVVAEENPLGVAPDRTVTCD